ncbi:hypothetical protein EVAR_85090_1, partial [Eumeta japonica]
RSTVFALASCDLGAGVTRSRGPICAGGEEVVALEESLNDRSHGRRSSSYGPQKRTRERTCGS